MVYNCIFPIILDDKNSNTFLKVLKPFFYLLINILVIAILDFSMSDFEEFRPFIIFKEIIVYNVFYISGYCFYINKKTFKELFLILIVSLILLYVFCWGKFPLIQEEKFPPTSIFLFYGIVMLSLLSIIFRIIKIRDVKLPKIWNHGGFTIYLYQNYAFWFYTVGSSFLLKLVPEYLYFYHSFIFSALVIFILSSILGCLFYPIECKVIKMFSRKQSNEK